MIVKIAGVDVTDDFSLNPVGSFSQRTSDAAGTGATGSGGLHNHSDHRAASRATARSTRAAVRAIHTRTTTTPTAVTLEVDGTVVSGTPTSRTDFDLTPYLSRDADGKITPNGVGRIQAAIVEVVFIQSRGTVRG